MRPEDFEPSSPRFVPEEYFLGRTEAWGFFQDRFGAVRREFHVTIDGSVAENKLTLDERFVYQDGARQQRVWRIEHRSEGEYEGVANDVVGIARGRAAGRAMVWDYEFDLPVAGTTMRVRFNDLMLLQDESVMINRATISKLGITLGEVFIFFKKVAEREASVAKSDLPAHELAQLTE